MIDASTARPWPTPWPALVVLLAGVAWFVRVAVGMSLDTSYARRTAPVVDAGVE